MREGIHRIGAVGAENSKENAKWGDGRTEEKSGAARFAALDSRSGAEIVCREKEEFQQGRVKFCARILGMSSLGASDTWGMRDR